MQNFTAYNPVKLHFGESCLKNLKEEAGKWMTKALIIIGKGSVKRNGVLTQVTNNLDHAGIPYTVFEGVKSNPEYQAADAAVKQGKDFGADGVIAVGGGSVIDTAKAVALGLKYDGSVWDFYGPRKQFPQHTAPLLAVLTLAATGTEMNCFSVLQDTQSGQKFGTGHPNMYPKASFLDPAFTLSVNAPYTAAGIADLIAHTLEQYFDPSFAPFTDAISVELIRQAFHWGLILMRDLQNLEARTQVMWLATVALNGTLAAGKKGGDWGVHAVEHVLSVRFDVPHGDGLSVVYPAWMKLKYGQIQDKLQMLTDRCTHSELTAPDFIQRLEQFFRMIGSPIRMADLGIAPEEDAGIVALCQANHARGVFFDLSEADHRQLLELARA